MVCKHHPNTPLEWQEVQSQTTHPFTGESILTYQDVEYCPKCFEIATVTGTWKHDLVLTKSEQIKNDIAQHIESKIAS